MNTLVLKNNAFTDLGKALHHCTALSKLSMAHNQLSDLGDSLQVSSWPLVPVAKPVGHARSWDRHPSRFHWRSTVLFQHVGILHAHKWPPAVHVELSSLCGRAGLHGSEGAPLESQRSRRAATKPERLPPAAHCRSCRQSHCKPEAHQGKRTSANSIVNRNSCKLLFSIESHEIIGLLSGWQDALHRYTTEMSGLEC